MPQSVSPLAPHSYPEMPHIEGVHMATAQAGIKYPGRDDVLLVLLDDATSAAGVFTRSRCPSAPVEWCKHNLGGGKARVLVVNSGNANAFTGMKGRHAVQITATEAARVAQVPENEVFLASTGVIGEPLEPEKFKAVLAGAAARARDGQWMKAAKAIMTTDTFPKLATRSIQLDDRTISINAFAKGAGMIAPDMATMLAFIFTDAAIAPDALQKLLSRHVRDSFNALTIDGDTSTSDTVLAFATGGAMHGEPPIAATGDARLGKIGEALHDTMLDLAIQIARDGEGASKLIRVDVRGAKSKASARKIAMSIANSPLVKTAMAGEDANWGRIVMAVGKAGEPAERDKLSIWFGDILVASDGERASSYSEAHAAAYMKNDEINITVDLALGNGRDTVYTCDLTHDYISINADYRS